MDQEVTIMIQTSIGEIERKQLIKFSDSNSAPVYNEVAITGFLTQFAAPAAGVILLIIILLVIVLIANKPQKAKKEKTANKEENKETKKKPIKKK